MKTIFCFAIVLFFCLLEAQEKPIEAILYYVVEDGMPLEVQEALKEAQILYHEVSCLGKPVRIAIEKKTGLTEIQATIKKAKYHPYYFQGRKQKTENFYLAQVEIAFRVQEPGKAGESPRLWYQNFSAVYASWADLEAENIKEAARRGIRLALEKWYKKESQEEMDSQARKALYILKDLDIEKKEDWPYFQVVPAIPEKGVDFPVEEKLFTLINLTRQKPEKFHGYTQKIFSDIPGINSPKLSDTKPFRISCNKPDGYEVGDSIVFSLFLEKPAYVYLYNLWPDGQWHKMFPNERQSNSYLTPGKWEIPDPKAEYDFQIQGLAGEDIVLALFSETPFPELRDSSQKTEAFALEERLRKVVLVAKKHRIDAEKKNSEAILDFQILSFYIKEKKR